MKPKEKKCEYCVKIFTAVWNATRKRYQNACPDCRLKRPWFRHFNYRYV